MDRKLLLVVSINRVCNHQGYGLILQIGSFLRWAPDFS